MIEISLDEKQLQSFFEQAKRRSGKAGVKTYLVWAIAIGLIAMVVDQRGGISADGLIPWLVGVPMVAGGWFLVIWFWNRDHIRRLAQATVKELGLQTIDFQDDGLRVINAKADTRHAWNSFVGYSEIDGLFVLWQSTSQGIVLPSAALDASDSKSRLIEILNSKGVAKWA